MKIIDFLKISKNQLFFKLLRRFLDFWLPTGPCSLCHDNSLFLVSQYGTCQICFLRLQSEVRTFFFESCYSCLFHTLNTYSGFRHYGFCKCTGNLIFLHSLFDYTQTFKDMLHKLKFYERFELSRGFAWLLYHNVFFRQSLKMGFVLVPVPSTTEKYKGYCAISLILRELKIMYGISYVNLLYSCIKIPQKTLNRTDRFANVHNKLFVKDKLYDKVLLFDDIATTGATVCEAIKTLLLHGVKEIRVLCLGNAAD